MKYDYCLYARKSTENDEQQALSIESQIKEMQAIADRDELNIVEIKRESHSAKASGQRSVFNELIDDLRNDKYQGIICWDTSRLSRNAGDLGMLVDLIDQRKLAEIRTFSQVFTNSPNDKFLLMILGSQAKLENDNRAINVMRGMRTKCDMGYRPCKAPLGYLNLSTSSKGLRKIIVDEERSLVVKKFFEMFASGISGRKILDWAFKIGFKTRQDKPYSINALYHLLTNTYYYGEFEWPVDSGNWYKVDHESIISKKLYDRVQRRLHKRPEKSRKLQSIFNFSHVMRCGECGSSIFGVRKYKSLSDGTKKKYIYYMCSKYVKRHCSQVPTNEELLISQFKELIDAVDLEKFLLKKEFEFEVKRFHELSKQIDNKHQKAAMLSVNVRNQMRFVLENESPEEKQRLLKNLGYKVLLKDKQIFLA